MTIAPEYRPSLPMWGKRHGGRSLATCHYKCGNACDRPVANESGGETFQQVATRALSRRTVLGGAAAAGLLGGASLAFPSTAAAAPGGGRGAAGGGQPLRGSSFSFTPIAPVPNDVDDVTVPEGWRWQPIIRWGDPITAGAPAWDPERQTPEAQAGQYGYNCDYLDVITIDRKGRQGLLVSNHEYTNEGIMFPPGTDPELVKRVAMQAHGMSVVEVRRQNVNRPWEYVQGSRYNRRLTATTEFAVDGPAAGSPLLQTSADSTGRLVLGTLNNCAGGTTPWGTVLSGEENFDQYFRARAVPTPEDRRYGLTSTSTRGWDTVDPRFDMSEEPNEPNRFGWIVEVDPMDPTSTPVKHTAMGRFKHEGATVRVLEDGQVVAYMGDDERFDYVYKFVSAGRYVEGDRDNNKRLLSEGDLYVARFLDDAPGDPEWDGTGEWLPLVLDGKSQVPGFTVERVLVYTRLAADVLQPTKMDRPEDVEPNPATGYVYIACTNNTRREPGQVDEANPRGPNKDGHVIEMVDDPTGTSFRWNVLLLCGDPADPAVLTYFGGWTGEVSPISCPDNVAFDDHGRLWISTDGQPGTIGYDDGLFLVPTEGFDRGHVQQFLAVPRDAETCGPVIRSAERTVYVSVQHPGDDGTYTSPNSLFPYEGNPIPRPSTIQVLRG